MRKKRKKIARLPIDVVVVVAKPLTRSSVNWSLKSGKLNWEMGKLRCMSVDSAGARFTHTLCEGFIWCGAPSQIMQMKEEKEEEEE